MADKKAPAKKKKGKQGEGGGRPSKLTPEVSDAICECIELGMSYQHSCDCVRVNYGTFCIWRNKAKDVMESKTPPSKYTAEQKKLVKFHEDIKSAEAKGIHKNLRCIRKAAEGDMENRPQWQAGAWLLERRHPDEFAKLEKIDQKTEHSGGVSIKLVVTDCSNKEE